MRIKSFLYNVLVTLDLRPQYLNSEDIILSRCACLGNDVLKLLRDRQILYSASIVNYQKLRVDGFVKSFTEKSTRLGFHSIARQFPRLDIRVCISMQSNRIFLRRSFTPKYIFIDDFSELTDSEFRMFKNGFTFFSGVGDLNSKFRLSNKIENLGLIPEEKITQAYDDFFKTCFTRWPDTKIFFLHFPTKLDSRSLYRDRGQVIRESIQSLSSKYENVFSFDCPVGLVDFGLDANSRSFPYHYSNGVYEWFSFNLSEKISSIEQR
jgi:hypothetical protein